MATQINEAPFVLRAKFGPPDITIEQLYDETPEQRGHLVGVFEQSSAERLMKDGYELVEDVEGVIDASKSKMTPEQAAELSGYARSTIYKYLRKGRLRADKVETTEGVRYRISRIDAEALREARGVN